MMAAILGMLQSGHSMQETIQIGKDVLGIEIKPITVICTSAEVSAGPRIEYPNRIRIDTDATIFHAKAVTKLHKDFVDVWKRFMLNTSNKEEVKYDITADNIRTFGMGSIHLMGLIDLSLKFRDLGIPFVWVHPESLLHPAWQVALADFAIYLSISNE